jgi:hypothetical protein
VRPIHARTLWRALHRESETELATRTDFLPPLQRWVAGRLQENAVRWASSRRLPRYREQRWAYPQISLSSR